MTRSLLRMVYCSSDWIKESLLVLWLWLPLGFRYTSSEQAPVIASLTSYPPRIAKSWMAIETLLRQTMKPQHLILVLNTEEFPTKKLPRRIVRQTRRGLQILWTERNGRSHDKLIPVRLLFPATSIITFDDDKFFPRNLVSELTTAATNNPGKVIGARGWEIRYPPSGRKIRFGDGWTRAQPNSSGQHLFLPGGNGCLYPHESLDPIVDDLDAALETCPNADDIWFWGALQRRSSLMMCLGMPPHRPVSALKAGPALSGLEESENERQFERALDFFGIRDRIEEYALPPVNTHV